jgi:polyisoprenoid-binding protein YceI
MTATGTGTVAPGTYRLDPDRCTVRFRTAHAFGLGPVHGTFAVREGVIVVGDESRITVFLDPASFTTDKPRRDKQIRSKAFLDVQRYPSMFFASTGVSGQVVSGMLTAHGVAAPVTLTLAAVSSAPDGLRCRATTRIDRYAFGVTTGRGLIGRYLDVELDVLSTVDSRSKDYDPTHYDYHRPAVELPHHRRDDSSGLLLHEDMQNSGEPDQQGVAMQSQQLRPRTQQD